LDLATEGAGSQVNFEFDPRQFQDLQIQGLTPFIFNITPIPSLAPLLGYDDQVEIEQVSSL
jgi:hypothetical protein